MSESLSEPMPEAAPPQKKMEAASQASLGCDCVARHKEARAAARRRRNLRARIKGGGFEVHGKPALGAPADPTVNPHPLHKSMMVAILEVIKSDPERKRLRWPGIFAIVLDFFKALRGGELVKAIEKDVINRLRISPLEYVVPAAPHPPPATHPPSPHLVSFAPRTRTRRRRRMIG